jgi:hypothetical protein
MDQLKVSLIRNKWIIDELLTPVRSKFAYELKCSVNEQTSTTYLTTSYYKPGDISSGVDSNKCKTLQIISSLSHLAPYFTKQTAYIFKAGTLLKNSNLIDITENWIKEFINFCEIQPNYQSLNNFLEYAILLEKVPFRGASHPHFLSSLFLQLKPEDTKFDFLVSLIHEAAHQELFLVNFVDRLVNEKFDHNLIHAPYQNKVRPLCLRSVAIFRNQAHVIAPNAENIQGTMRHPLMFLVRLLPFMVQIK